MFVIGVMIIVFMAYSLGHNDREPFEDDED